MNFTARLKLALVGDQRARFVYLNNFEVERSWARGEPALPGAGIAFAATTVNRMEELGVLLADSDDVVVLKAPVDPGYAAYLDRLGAAAGRTLWTENSDPSRTVTEDALASPDLITALRALDDGRTYLMPLGVSPAEEELSKETGLPLAGPAAQTCKAVNGKIFSRRLAEAHGLTEVPGAIVATAGELADALREHLLPGRKAVVKESLGVSGRGMVVLDDPERAERLIRMVNRRGGERVDYVVERWIDKALDLNYQVIVSRRGEVTFEAVKAAVVAHGVHKGHRFPVTLSDDQLRLLREAGEVIGKALFAEGYFGVVGIDAMLGRDGTVYPCLEINARFNMSTYQSRVAERFVGTGKHAVAATIGLRPHRQHTFDEVADALGTLLHDGSDRPGFLINNFATLNAAADPGGARFHGRIYGICIADDQAGALELLADVERALDEMVSKP